MLCSDALCLIDNLLLILDRQGLATAIGSIDDQIVIAPYNAGKEKPLYPFCFQLAGQVHRRSQIVFH